MDTRTILILGLLVLGVGLSLAFLLPSAATIGENGVAGELPSPELILAETVVRSIEFGAFIPLACPDIREISLPENLLYETNGQRKSDSDINAGFDAVFCLLDAGTADPENLTNSDMLRLLEIYDGEDVRFSNGVVMPGESEAVRSGLFYMSMIGVSFAETLILGNNQCDVLAEWSSEGATLEKRVLGFALFMLLESVCIDENPVGTTEAMLERTREGDIEAAVQLIRYWNFENLEGVPQNVASRDLGDIDSKIRTFESLIAESAEDHPLVSVAATLQIINLVGLKQFPHMLFR